MHAKTITHIQISKSDVSIGMSDTAISNIDTFDIILKRCQQEGITLPEQYVQRYKFQVCRYHIKRPEVEYGSITAANWPAPLKVFQRKPFWDYWCEIFTGHMPLLSSSQEY